MRDAISRLLSRRPFATLAALLLALIVVGGVAFQLGRVAGRSDVWDGPDTEENLAPVSVATPPGTLWFDDFQNVQAISEEDAEEVAHYVSASVLNRGARPVEPPAVFGHDASPRMVFISIGDGLSPAIVVRGSGRGIAEAVDEALAQADTSTVDGYRPTWAKVDIVQEVLQLDDVDPVEPQPDSYERSLYGLAFDEPSNLAFVPEELVAHTLVDSDQEIRFQNIASHLGGDSRLRGLENAESVTVYRFSTLSFFSDGENLIRLYRGHRLFDRPSTDELLSAAVAGGEYLSRAVGPDGKFVYAYLPKSDSVADDYNILRHAGTTYSMLELVEVTGDDELLEAAERALDYLVKSAMPCQVGSETFLCIVEAGEVKLGGNGLAAIALAKYSELTGDDQYLPVLIDLGRWIQAVQSESGEFSVHKQSYPEGEVIDFVSGYYPGEALLAMSRIYAVDPDEAWLDTAENGARYLIEVRDAGLPISDLDHDHWLLYALNDLYRYRPDPTYFDHAMRIKDAIVQSQNRQPAYPDWLGSYYQPPRSTPTATRNEGLSAAYALAQDFGSPDEAAEILDAIRLGAAFQLQTQFQPESVLYLDDPQRSLGGFHRSLTNYEIRIDYVQHNISAILALYQIEAVAQSNPP